MCGGAGMGSASSHVASTGPGASPFKPDVNPWYLHAAIWLAIIVAVAVGFGVINMSDPTLAWLYALTVAPALVFTLAGSAIGRYTGSPWHPLKKALVFIGAASVSAALTVLIAILLLMAAIVAFLQWCFSGMPPM